MDRRDRSLDNAPVCPACKEPMVVFELDGVEIDRCPRGHGLWFDRNEMETLIAASPGGDGGAMARFLGELRPAGKKKGD